MRDIKFRVWNFQLKKYIKAIEMNITGNMVRTWDEKFYSPFEVVLEQYTCLKDKNGVEIYEGDIVQYGEDRDFIFVVIFKYGCFYAHNILGEKFMTDSILGSLVMSEKVSVIGNIHENAELLEGQS